MIERLCDRLRAASEDLDGAGKAVVDALKGLLAGRAEPLPEAAWAGGLEAAQRLRTALAEAAALGVARPAPADVEGRRASVEAVCAALAALDLGALRLDRLRQELAALRCLAAPPRRQAALRRAQANALAALEARDAARRLPPAAGISWLTEYLSLDEAARAAMDETLTQAALSPLADLLSLLEPADWAGLKAPRATSRPATAPPSDGPPAARTAPGREAESSGAPGSASEPEPEPALEALPEPVLEAAPEPALEAEPAPEPALEAEPAPEPVLEPVLEAEPAPEPVLEPVLEAAPAPEPALEAEPERDPQPASTPAALDPAPPAAAPPAMAATLALHLASTCWDAEAGAPAPAPWHEVTAAALSARCRAALAAGDLRGAWLAAQASATVPPADDPFLPDPILRWALTAALELSRGAPPPYPRPAALEHLDELPTRCALAWEAGDQDAVRLVLWALALVGLIHDEDLCALARECFEAPLVWLADGCRRVTGRLPVAHLAAEVHGPPGPEALARQVKDARSRLRTEFKRLQSAAGGRIQRTHCRTAWSAFIELLRPHYRALLDAEAPLERDALDGLREAYVREADRHGARFSDRTIMDRAADDLIDALHALQRSLEAQRAGSAPPEPVFDPRLIQALRDLTLQPPLLRWLRQATGLTSPAARPWWLTVADLYARPGLIEAIGAIETAGEDWQLDLRSLERPAAAALAWDAPPRPPLEPVDGPPTLHRLHDALAAAERWPDVARISPRPGAIGRQLDARLSELQDRGSALCAQLEALALELDSLGHPGGGDAARAAGDAWRDLAAAPGAALWSGLTWLDAARHRAGWQRQRAGAELTDSAPADRRAEVAARLAAGDLSGAARLAGAVPTAPAPLEALRDTPFTLPDGAARWWREISLEDPALSPATRALLSAWRPIATQPLRSPSEAAQSTLLDAWMRWLLELDDARRKSAFVTTKGARRIDVAALRRWVQRADQPSFLPQLAHLDQLRIQALLKPPAQLAPRHLQQQAQPGDLVLILAPGCRLATRADFVTAQRQTSNGAVALITDAELVRLLRPFGDHQPDPLRGTLEIALEQQPWLAQQPFDTGDGDRIKPEMFVGRSTEIEALARQGRYGRIFAGRKLGKTALLRSVQQRTAARPLPSGLQLITIPLNIGGISDPLRVAQHIAEGVGEALGAPLPLAPGADPGEALTQQLRDALRTHPDRSLLILLDEADAFVEAEGLRYRAQADETGLTWIMRNQIERAQDRSGLSRVRFVFCGYRETWRAEGAFANWRELLQLRPLEPQDAALLFAGPLARLGVDARAVAADVAWRCGRQPALIHELGRALLQDLARRIPPARRDGYQIRPEDIAQIAHAAPLRDRIRDICWLNFVGNPQGKLLFAAFLLELRDAPLGQPLEDVPQRLRRRLSGLIEGPLTAIFEGTWEDAVTHALRALVSADLLTEAPRGHFRLAFAQHLPLLLASGPEQKIREAAQALSGQAPPERAWLLDRQALDHIEYALGPEGQEIGITEVVIATHWAAPFADLDRGLRVRLNLDVREAGDGLVVTPETTPPRRVRWLGGPALRAAIAAGDAVERVPLYRLSPARQRGWFQGVRTLELTGDAPWARIDAATGGIPALLGALDEALLSRFGQSQTLDRAQLDQALKDQRARLPALWAALDLTAREEAIIDLAIAASDHPMLSDPELWRETLADGELLAELGLDAHPPLTPADDLALSLLTELGLLRRDPLAPRQTPRDTLLPLPPDDPLRRWRDAARAAR